MTHKPHCYQTDPEATAHDAPCICDDPPEPKHTALCHEFWDRGLECRCIPSHVIDALRNGADPEDFL